MSRETVESYEQVVESVRSFNKGLEEGKDLETLLSYFRAWYYVPELDAVGPSKFIGYKGMTAEEYMKSTDLDGRETEPILSRWFDIQDGESAEDKYIDDLTKCLLARFDKVPNRAVRYNAKLGWKLGVPNSLPPSDDKQGESAANDKRPIVEVFWRAFLSLYPEDQDILARRIVEHFGKRR